MEKVTRANLADISQQAESVCDTCHGQGEVWTGENQSFGYMSMQPPEPIMEACPECGGEAESVEPAVAQSYKDDPRTAAELSAAGCRCVRFGEGNPHWPCRIHAAPPQPERVSVPVELAERLAAPLPDDRGWQTWHTQDMIEASKELRALLASSEQEVEP